MIFAERNRDIHSSWSLNEIRTISQEEIPKIKQRLSTIENTGNKTNYTISELTEKIDTTNDIIATNTNNIDSNEKRLTRVEKDNEVTKLQLGDAVNEIDKAVNTINNNNEKIEKLKEKVEILNKKISESSGPSSPKMNWGRLFTDNTNKVIREKTSSFL